MSTIDPTVEQAVGASSSAGVPSIVATLTSADHKVVGRLLITASLAVSIAVGVVGVVLGLERIGGEDTLLSDRALTSLFAGFRVGLVLGSVVPLLLGLCVAVVPLQVGARSLAFPRAAAAGLWTWFGGLVLLVIALVDEGGPNGTNPDMVGLYLGALGLMTIGLTLVAATIATSVLTTRAPGMKLHRVPLFSWSALVYGVGLVLALPMLLGAVIYLYLDVRYASAEVTLFGGAAGIDDWASWLLTGPSLALFAVPAVGILGDLVPLVFSKRTPSRSIALVGLALVGAGVLAAVTQRRVIVLPGTGNAVDGSNWLTKLGILANWAIMALLPALGVVIVLGLIAVLGKPAPKTSRTPAARPRLLGPFVFALFGSLLVLLGIIGGAVNGIEDLGLIGTVYEEGAAVALVYGSVLSGLGGVAYWAPKWSGRRVADVPVAGLGLLGALGALLASAPYYIAGFADQPAAAAVFDYDGPSSFWNLLVTLGHGLFAVVVVAFVGLVARPGRAGDAAGAGDDPWGGQTLEWATTSPAPADNFASTPVVGSAEPLLDLKARATAREPAGSPQ
jgi:heme/copper-type cytochrome/quinol oxidase subunit 1